ncbi:hypothetical protein C8F04DRAFT_1365378 [Mycena alexandri]|uniref:Uncharacterized protein n=1 Tax=Mycena alexandri TaxID=1745969 RepID=A0AAD6SQV5_9AGAR|nr:hypothetical protein C8F04DRAFT_1365378 [Mycena alexandri]
MQIYWLTITLSTTHPVPPLLCPLIQFLQSIIFGQKSPVVCLSENLVDEIPQYLSLFHQAQLSARCSDLQIVADINTSAPSITVVFLECDLESLEYVKQAAEQFVSQSDRLDVLVCNAGAMNVPPALTKDGYEVYFGLNHLAHALFIKLLLPTLLRTAESPNANRPRSNVLVCNAGVMNVPPALTKDGYEVYFGLNQLAHALFIKLLLPTLLRTAETPNADTRVCVVRRARLDAELFRARTYEPARILKRSSSLNHTVEGLT